MSLRKLIKNKIKLPTINQVFHGKEEIKESEASLNAKKINKVANLMKQIAESSFNRVPRDFDERYFAEFESALKEKLSQNLTAKQLDDLVIIMSKHNEFAKNNTYKFRLPFYSQIVLKKELVKEYQNFNIEEIPCNLRTITGYEYSNFKKDKPYKLYKYTYLDFEKDEDGKYVYPEGKNISLKEKTAFALADENDFLIATCAEDSEHKDFFVMHNFANLEPEKRISFGFDQYQRWVTYRYFSSTAKSDDVFMETLGKKHNCWHNKANQFLLSKNDNQILKIWTYEPKITEKNGDSILQVLQIYSTDLKKNIDCQTLKFVGKTVFDDDYFVAKNPNGKHLTKEEIRKVPQYVFTVNYGSERSKLDVYDFIYKNKEGGFSVRENIGPFSDSPIISHKIKTIGNKLLCEVCVPCAVIEKVDYNIKGEKLKNNYYDFSGNEINFVKLEKNLSQNNEKSL